MGRGGCGGGRREVDIINVGEGWVRGRGGKVT